MEKILYRTSKNNYKKVSLASFSKNIEIHLVSFIWIAKIFADAMKIKKKEALFNWGLFMEVLARMKAYIIIQIYLRVFPIQ